MKTSRKKRLVTALLIIILIAAGAVVWKLRDKGDGQLTQAEGTPASVVPVRTTPLRTMEFRRRLALSGNVQAKNTAVVSTRVGGTLEEIYVDEGDAVVAGETKLFRTNSVSLANAFEIAKQQLAVADCSVAERRAYVEQVSADLTKASLDYDRFKRLYEQDGAVTKDAFELQESRYLQSTAVVKHAEALRTLAERQRDQAESNLAIARKSLDDALVHAPISGVVNRRYMEPGEEAKAQTRVLEIVDRSLVEVSCFAPAEAYATVEPGKTSLRIVCNGSELGAPVSYVSPTIHPALRTFEVRCELAAPPAAVVPGAIAEVECVLESHDGLGIPVEAVQQRGGRDVVFLVGDGKAQMLAVRTGLQNDGLVEVASDGLEEGARIVTMGQFLLNDGTPVLAGGEG